MRKVKGLRQSIDKIKNDIDVKVVIKSNKFMKKGCFNEYMADGNRLI